MIEEFGEFRDAEVFTGGHETRPRVGGAPVLALRYEPSRDIMWAYMSRSDDSRPSVAWLCDDQRLPLVVHLDEDGRLLSIGIGDASRLLPPALLLQTKTPPMNLMISKKDDAAQLSFIHDSLDHHTEVLTVQPSGPEGPALNFVFEPSRLLIGVVITRLSELGHPTLLGALQ